MTGPVIRAFDAVVDDVNVAERSVVARINTSSVDRYNTVIAAKGANWKNWKRAGMPVLWEHGKHPVRHTDPIGNGKGIWNNGGPNPTEILAEPRFLEDDFSQQRFEWYRDGVIRGWSVSILPTSNNAGPPTPAELRSRPDWEGAHTIYREWDLAEFSGTVIPGNAEALTAPRATALLELVQRNGLWFPDELKPIVEARASATDDPEPVERKIVSEGGKFYVYSEDGKKKLGGPYKTKEEAEKRLKQVEYFKHEGEHKDKEESRSAPYIDSDGLAWVVRSADGAKIASFADEETAELCLADTQRNTLVMVGSLMQRNHQELMGQFDEIRRDLKNEIALRIHGVV